MFRICKDPLPQVHQSRHPFVWLRISDGHLPLLFRVPEQISHGLHLNEEPLSDRRAILEAAGGGRSIHFVSPYNCTSTCIILIFLLQSRIVFVVQFYLIWFFVSIFRECTLFLFQYNYFPQFKRFLSQKKNFGLIILPNRSFYSK